MGYEQDLIDQGLCPEVVPVLTEDGPATGRCMGPIPPGSMHPACEGHAAEIGQWFALTEAEKLHWERQQEEYR